MSTKQRISLLDLIREDGAANLGSAFRPGFQAMLSYRLGRWAKEGTFLRRPVLWLATVLQVMVRNLYGIEIYFDATIGRRLTIGHQGAITIHKYCRIGDDCMIRQGVTIGGEVEFIPDNAPTLGDNVEVGSGAVIMSGIRIGAGVKIGPNAVVAEDVPNNSIVVSPPSRVLRR